MAMNEQEQAGLADQDFAAFLAWANKQSNWLRINAALELVGLAGQAISGGHQLEVRHLGMAVEAATWLSGLAQGQGIERLSWYFSTVAQGFQLVLDVCGE